MKLTLQIQLLPDKKQADQLKATIDARRGEQTRGEYLDSLTLGDPPSSS
jgi:hypothetical protein